MYLFFQQSDEWGQQAYIKASDIDWIDFRDYFGGSVSLSANGNTLLIGEPGEDNNESGVNGDQNTIAPATESSGAAYVFTRSGSQWSQQAYLKASNTGWEIDLVCLSVSALTEIQRHWVQQGNQAMLQASMVFKVIVQQREPERFTSIDTYRVFIKNHRDE